MTDEQAFVAKIVAELDDVGLRLAFADWLEEQGRGQEAQFLRSHPSEPPPVEPFTSHFEDSGYGHGGGLSYGNASGDGTGWGEIVLYGFADSVGYGQGDVDFNGVADGEGYGIGDPDLYGGTDDNGGLELDSESMAFIYLVAERAGLRRIEQE